MDFLQDIVASVPDLAPEDESPEEKPRAKRKR